ncbi:hypothetical protein AGDE_07746 [Angomonas deanei]|nr:hypothetical protein AGDE_07746 [Angomonas deanei]|eukprot:EPY34890.1 hypothetical protein AGDE_07746 [Angomonas deanei]
MVEQLDEAKQARNPTFTASHTLVNNGLDLLTHLEAAKRMQTWQDALSLFTQSTNTTVRRSGADWEWSRTSPTATGIVPREEHLCVLLDTLAAGEQWDLIRGIGHYYGKSLPPVLTHVVRLLAYYAPVEGETEEQLAQARCTAAYDYLTHCKVPPPDRPVEAYTECLAACERANDWQGALRIVRSMGPNPLQGWRSAEEGEGEATTSEPVDGLAPPSPNVVSYATLIAVLEQCGKDKIAAEVLLRLPSLEQAEITASYAALIHVWSKQIYSKQQRRF